MPNASPNRHISFKVATGTGGGIAGLVVTFDVAGGGSLIAATANGASSSFDLQVPNDFTLMINFPNTGTWVAGDIFTFSPSGVLTHSGTGTAVPTIRATSPLTNPWGGAF